MPISCLLLSLFVVVALVRPLECRAIGVILLHVHDVTASELDAQPGVLTTMCGVAFPMLNMVSVTLNPFTNSCHFSATGPLFAW